MGPYLEAFAPHIHQIASSKGLLDALLAAEVRRVETLTERISFINGIKSKLLAREVYWDTANRVGERSCIYVLATLSLDEQFQVVVDAVSEKLALSSQSDEMQDLFEGFLSQCRACSTMEEATRILHKKKKRRNAHRLGVIADDPAGRLRQRGEKGAGYGSCSYSPSLSSLGGSVVTSPPDSSQQGGYASSLSTTTGGASVMSSQALPSSPIIGGGVRTATTALPPPTTQASEYTASEESEEGFPMGTPPRRTASGGGGGSERRASAGGGENGSEESGRTTPSARQPLTHHHHHVDEGRSGDQPSLFPTMPPDPVYSKRGAITHRSRGGSQGSQSSRVSRGLPNAERDEEL